MLWFLPEFSSILHPACLDAHRNLGGLRLFCEERGGGGGALESRVDFGGVGGGWHKRKNLQISDVQRLASLFLSYSTLY